MVNVGARPWQRRSRGAIFGSMVFTPFEPEPPLAKRRRFRAIPVRTLVPNLITLLILRTLQNGPMHGWSISERIQQIFSREYDSRWKKPDPK